MSGNLSDASVDVVVLTTREVERRAVLRVLPNPELFRHGGRTFQRASLGPYLVVVPPLLGVGGISAAAETIDAVTTWGPARILFVGALGGLRPSPELQCGDVMIPDRPGGQDVPGDQEFFSQRYLPDPDLLTAARHVDREAWVPRIGQARPRSYNVDRGHPVAHVGPVADGLRLGLLRVEVESLGLVVAAGRGTRRTGFMVIKGVYDDAPAPESRLSYAANSAAGFMAALLEATPFVAMPRTRARSPGSPSFGGAGKIQVCRRLFADWEDLADYFEIEPYEKARFKQGREPQEIWEWLEARSMLHALPDALKGIGRSDLIPLLDFSLLYGAG